VWLGERLGETAYWLQPRRTRIGLLNLRAAFDGRWQPAEARRIIRACYRQLGAGILELLRLPVMDRAYVDRYITVSGRASFDAALAAGRPVMLLTGHYGNWELSSIVAALSGAPVVALARAQNKFPRLYRLLVSYRESKGCTIVHKGGAMRRLIAALEAGQPVGIVGDQATRQGVLVELFGRPALFATGPFDLAYAKGAVVLPVFIRRIRGAHHHIMVDPAIAVDRSLSQEHAIRQSITRFAAALTHHVTEDPSQWLWMHKRWKHTPARRVLVLSDGKLGHVKQSLGVVEAFRESGLSVSHQVVEIRYRHRAARALALLWSWLLPRAGAARCLSAVLEPAAAEALLGRYADVVVSCGASLGPVNLLWAAENRAKSVTVMNPAPLPLGRFHLVIAPRHDRLPERANVVRIAGAVNRVREEDLARAGERLRAHPKFRLPAGLTGRSPAVAVFIGGETDHQTVTAAFAEALIAQVQAGTEAAGGWYLATTSRRTSPAVERLLAERLHRDGRCGFLVLASRDSLDGTLEGMLGLARVAVVTGESVSMVSEACASGRAVLVVEPPLRGRRRAALTKPQRFLRRLQEDGFARIVPVPELGATLRRLLADPHPAKRLDDFDTVCQAVRRLL